MLYIYLFIYSFIFFYFFIFIFIIIFFCLVVTRFIHVSSVRSLIAQSLIVVLCLMDPI